MHIQGVLDSGLLLLEVCAGDDQPQDPKSGNLGNEVKDQENDSMISGFYTSVVLGFNFGFWEEPVMPYSSTSN